MNKMNPKNKEIAFSYQFEDTVRLLKSLANLGQTEAFKQMLQTLKMHINTYENQRGELNKK